MRLLSDTRRAYRGGPAAIAARQRVRLAAQVTYARTRSPFHRELYAGVQERVEDPWLCRPPARRNCGILGPILVGLAVGAGWSTTQLFAALAVPMLVAALTVLAQWPDAGTRTHPPSPAPRTGNPTPRFRTDGSC